MPELPEVETVKETLKNFIIGRTIKAVVLKYDKIIKYPSVDEFVLKITNQTFTDIRRYGKYLLFDLNDFTMVSHLRMEGKYYIKDLEEDRKKHEHVIFYFTDDTTMRYHDTRKFGTFDLILKKNLETFHPIQKLGPEPFGQKMNADYLHNTLKGKTVAIKTALLDQTIIAGLGNLPAVITAGFGIGLFEKYVGAIIGTAYEVAAPVSMLLIVLVFRQISMRKNRQAVK